MSRVVNVSALLLGLLGCPVWVSAACHVTTTGLNFGAYETFDTADTRSTARITVSCNLVLPTPVTLALGPSAHTSSGRGRSMRSGTSLLQYDVYLDPALTQVWGEGTSEGRAVINRVSHSTPWTLTVYGRIPAQQSVRAGVYSDKLVVTITW